MSPEQQTGILARWDLNWILALLLAVFAIAPLTYPGFFEAQSGFLPPFNATHLSDAPNWGRVADPVRGEGKLPYLLTQPLGQGQPQVARNLPNSGVIAVKWGYAVAFLLGALGTYAWTRRWLGSRGGVLAAVVYTYLPWHLGTVYVRGAYAEAWLWAFWPWLPWALDRMGEQNLRSTLVGTGASLLLLAATLWTQPGLALLAIPLLLAYAALSSTRSPRPLSRLFVMVGLGLFLLWFTARRLPEAQSLFADHFLYPFQLLSAAWGEGLSFQLGLAAVGLSIVTLALWAAKKSPRASEAEDETASSAALERTLWFWTIALAALVFFTLSLSAFLWQISGFSRLLTYPWQLLALAGLPLAFLGGAVIRLDRRLATLPSWAGLVTLVVLASYPYLSPRFTQVDPGPEPVALFQPVGAGTPQITLLDYEIAPPTEITPTLALTLTWQAVEPVAGDYTVFVHILSGDNIKVAQRDTRPCDGTCPTNAWPPGEIVVDRYELSLDPGAPPAPYRLAIGLYLLETGDRAIVAGRDDGTVYLDVQ
jgi:hypothetical protein